MPDPATRVQMVPTLDLWSVQGTSLGVAFLRGPLCWSDHALGVAQGPVVYSNEDEMWAYGLRYVCL